MTYTTKNRIRNENPLNDSPSIDAELFFFNKLFKGYRKLKRKILAMLLSCYSIAQVGISKGRMDIAMA
jgi:hypothetical protein